MIYVLMHLAWAQKILWAAENGGYYVEYYWMSYLLGLFDGNLFGTLSSLLALAALIVSLFIVLGKVRRPIACGILLLLSAVAEIVNGCVFGFERFTGLTYCIITALIRLGLFALFGFLGSQQNVESEKAPSNDA